MSGRTTWGVVTFPGSNCDRDCQHVLRAILGQTVVEVWHENRSLDGIDALVLPGGFSYGDYLRSGAVAATAPVMGAVRAFAASGRPVLGICNGFQVLTEAGLLPGALVRNRGLRFRCAAAWVRVESTETPFTAGLRAGQIMQMPIAHGDGAYLAAPEAIAALDAQRRVVFRYCDRSGREVPAANPNGSLAHIAGIASPAGNVVGLMPHPERASELLLGSTDGRALFESAVTWMLGRRAPAAGGVR
ncbi:MAG: phosphoribosylformylglycinamidine synthase subunit PurQ [Armatimonadota bacterium]|nr:phosphoribosylformylglycinamidine synthase subunit PurQ [Armatimonadota bacterium]MDR7520057.1 phosphoribosylformylglycinamidine synthase subunit PurQ [Armatimonadota bacterium]MDR7551030.1 phosphoribosylformylglycinamidine synthase subunit PurQ [Armatimonadota bacterium]